MSFLWVQPNLNIRNIFKKSAWQKIFIKKLKLGNPQLWFCFYGFFFHLRFILKCSQQCVQAITILHYFNWMVWSGTSVNPNWFAVRFSWWYLDHFERFPFDRVSNGLDSYNVRVGLGQVVQVAVDVVYFVVVLPSHTMPWIIVVNNVISIEDTD